MANSMISKSRELEFQWSWCCDLWLETWCEQILMYNTVCDVFRGFPSLCCDCDCDWMFYEWNLKWPQQSSSDPLWSCRHSAHKRLFKVSSVQRLRMKWHHQREFSQTEGKSLVVLTSFIRLWNNDLKWRDIDRCDILMISRIPETELSKEVSALQKSTEYICDIRRRQADQMQFCLWFLVVLVTDDLNGKPVAETYSFQWGIFEIFVTFERGKNAKSSILSWQGLNSLLRLEQLRQWRISRHFLVLCSVSWAERYSPNLLISWNKRFAIARKSLIQWLKS